MTTAQMYPAHSITTLDRIGFELGWDYAHHRVCPPEAYAQAPSPMTREAPVMTLRRGDLPACSMNSVRSWLNSEGPPIRFDAH
mgnify:CR=1 FL=1